MIEKEEMKQETSEPNPEEHKDVCEENPGQDVVTMTQFEDLNNQYRRLAADFDNYRRRVERQSQEQVLRANQGLINDMLPIMDGFNLALAKANPQEPFVKGMEMVFQQLVDILGRNGLQCIPALGCQFDPTLHEAIGFVETDQVADNTIVDEIRQGYLLSGRVLRPSMVRVSKSEKEEDR